MDNCCRCSRGAMRRATMQESVYTHTLRHAVDFLDGLGYHTYYAGRSLLMPLWGSHWREPYGLGRWSDMVALQAHSSFERYFLRQFLPGPPCPR